MVRKLAAPNRRPQDGFTLIELLVVIIILGILAAVVVFAVSGIGDRGEEAACEIDTRTLETAQEANFAENGSYAASESALVVNGFLSNQSNYHDITDVVPSGPGLGYLIRVRDDQCGQTTPTPDIGALPVGSTFICPTDTTPTAGQSQTCGDVVNSVHPDNN